VKAQGTREQKEAIPIYLAYKKRAPTGVIDIAMALA